VEDATDVAEIHTRGGDFLDLLHAVAMRLQSGLDRDTLGRKAAKLRERGSL
jgi:hypothetical protein